MRPSLRILFLAGRDPLHSQAGGGDIQAWAWAHWAVRQGHRVVYICQSDRGLPEVEESEGIQVKRLGKGAALGLRAWRYYRRHEGDFDLIYEDPIGAGRTPYLSPLYSRVPIVAVWHQVSSDLLRAMHSGPVAAMLETVERWLARVYRRTWLWVPSEERASEVSDILGFARSRISVIPPTIPGEMILSDPPSSREPLVVFLGLIRTYKSIPDLIHAFQSVVKEQPDARLIVAGRSSDLSHEDYLRQLVTDLSLSDRVSIQTNVTETQKRDLLASARALVLPSLLEGFGIVILEANAVGTPVIASSGVPHAAAEEGRNSIRFEHGDREALATAILKLVENDHLFLELSPKSIEHAKQFTPARVGEKFSLLLTSALDG